MIQFYYFNHYESSLKHAKERFIVDNVQNKSASKKNKGIRQAL